MEKYLEKCLDSIINQTYKSIEIILVDDGSPDGCGAICDSYAAKDSRIRVIHKKNEGVSSARNAGLDICTGDYISFIDSDDYISPFFFEIMWGCMQSSESDIAALYDLVQFAHEDTIVDFAHSNQEYSSYVELEPLEAIRLMLYQKLLNGVPLKLFK